MHRQPLLGWRRPVHSGKHVFSKGVCSAARQSRRFKVNFINSFNRLNRMSDPHSVIVCPACDLLIERKLLPLRRHAHCPRCHQHLYGRYAFRPSQLMALTITGFLLLPSAFLSL
jgi:hypothetical protein